MSKHTPGPWQAKQNKCSAAVYDGYGSALARLPASDYYAGRRMADAQLMAAAPDLLMALQMLYDETADYIRLNNLGGMDNQCMQLARAAMARAVGAA